jgi:hypothetical protein
MGACPRRGRIVEDLLRQAGHPLHITQIIELARARFDLPPWGRMFIVTGAERQDRAPAGRDALTIQEDQCLNPISPSWDSLVVVI